MNYTVARRAFSTIVDVARSRNSLMDHLRFRDDWNTVTIWGAEEGDLRLIDLGSREHLDYGLEWETGTMPRAIAPGEAAPESSRHVLSMMTAAQMIEAVFGERISPRLIINIVDCRELARDRRRPAATPTQVRDVECDGLRLSRQMLSAYARRKGREVPPIGGVSALARRSATRFGGRARLGAELLDRDGGVARQRRKRRCLFPVIEWRFPKPSLCHFGLRNIGADEGCVEYRLPWKWPACRKGGGREAFTYECPIVEPESL